MDDINVQVTCANTEDASMVAGFIGESLSRAGFRNVDVQSSILSNEPESYMAIIRETSPHLFNTQINVGFDGTEGPDTYVPGVSEDD